MGRVRIIMIESLAFMYNAMTMLPSDMKGALITSLISIATASCKVLMSFVSLVVYPVVPISSSSLDERDMICLNRAFLTSVPKPWEAMEAEY